MVTETNLNSPVSKVFGSTFEEICALVACSDQKMTGGLQIDSEQKAETESSNLSDVANFSSEESFSLSDDRNEISFDELSE